MRRLVLFLLALLCVAPVAAQIMVRPGVIAPRVPQPQASPQGTQFDIANDPERARAEINRLRGVNRQLRQSFSMTLADLQDLRRQLDEMTRLGGSMVMAQCVSQTLSRNTAGASENCAASGYTCSPVSGLCNRICNDSNMCSAGFACNMDNHHCEVPKPAEDD